MTTPGGAPFNVAGDASRVGVQTQNAYFDTVTIPGDVQLTIGQDASPASKYRVGVHNLESSNPSVARRLIWEAMMGDYQNSRVLFHWLVAMLSGRTMRQFSKAEIDQLQRYRSWCADGEGDAWADGVRLIYRLLDSVLSSPANEVGPKTAATDMSLLASIFRDRAVVA